VGGFDVLAEVGGGGIAASVSDCFYCGDRGIGVWHFLLRRMGAVRSKGSRVARSTPLVVTHLTEWWIFRQDRLPIAVIDNAEVDLDKSFEWGDCVA
jgi:hypothetical protein